MCKQRYLEFGCEGRGSKIKEPEPGPLLHNYASGALMKAGELTAATASAFSASPREVAGRFSMRLLLRKLVQPRFVWR